MTINRYDNDATGNQGVNVVVFSGHRDEYTITRTGLEVTVSDHVPG